MNKYDIKYYIYGIYYNDKPIYIGSTSDISVREKSHNNNLKKRKNIMSKIDNVYLSNDIYDFCIKNNINKIKLKEISSGFNDLVIISNGKFEWRRFIEEDKYIKYCIDKGCDLKNLKWSTYYDEKKNLRTVENSKIKYYKESIIK